MTGRDPILLLLHDEGRSSEQWKEFVPLLESRFRVLTPDLPPGDEPAAIDVGGTAKQASWSSSV